MAADAWVVHDDFKQELGAASVDMDDATAGAFKMSLHTSTSTVSNTSEGNFATFTGTKAEHANQGAPGYETGGKAIQNPTWTKATVTTTFDCDDVTWTATGGNMVARFACIYYDDHASDLIVCHSLLENPAADVTATTGNDFKITIHADGVFDLS